MVVSVAEILSSAPRRPCISRSEPCTSRARSSCGSDVSTALLIIWQIQQTRRDVRSSRDTPSLTEKTGTRSSKAVLIVFRVDVLWSRLAKAGAAHETPESTRSRTLVATATDGRFAHSRQNGSRCACKSADSVEFIDASHAHRQHVSGGAR